MSIWPGASMPPLHVQLAHTCTLHWRHNDHGGVSNHQPRGCLLNRLFRHRWKKTTKLRVTGLCAGNSPGPVNSPHKGPVTRKMFPFDDVIMMHAAYQCPIPITVRCSYSAVQNNVIFHTPLHWLTQIINQSLDLFGAAPTTSSFLTPSQVKPVYWFITKYT